MIPSFPGPGNPKQHRLLTLFNRLDKDRQQQLLDFAEFLNQKKANADDDSVSMIPGQPTKPADIPRPDQESVVAAIKRLSKTYTMLNKDEMLHQTSDLMSEHIIKGRPAPDVIDDLELMFTTHYEAHLERFTKSD